MHIYVYLNYNKIIYVSSIIMNISSVYISISFFSFIVVYYSLSEKCGQINFVLLILCDAFVK